MTDKKEQSEGEVPSGRDRVQPPRRLGGILRASKWVTGAVAALSIGAAGCDTKEEPISPDVAAMKAAYKKGSEKKEEPTNVGVMLSDAQVKKARKIYKGANADSIVPTPGETSSITDSKWFWGSIIGAKALFLIGWWRSRGKKSAKKPESHPPAH